MPTTDAARLLLFADGPRRTGPGVTTHVRRYRLARLRLEEGRRAEAEPRYAHLKRAHD